MSSREQTGGTRTEPETPEQGGGTSDPGVSITGEPIHTRCLAVAFSVANEGSLAFRSDVIDLRKAGLMSLAGRLSAAGIIHKMSVGGRFETATGRIEAIEWDQSHVMHEANRATRGECCRDPMPRLQGLVGQSLGDDFVASLKACFGGPLGCTHVNTLLQELNAVFRALRARLAAHPDFLDGRAAGDRVTSRSVYVDAAREDAAPTVALSARLADLHFAPCAGGAEILHGHEEVRVAATIDLAGWKLRSLRGVERRRTGPSCDEGTWRSRDEAVAALAGRSLGGGMAKHVLERFGGEPEDALLCSALLALGPGMTQVGAGLSESLAPAESAGPLGGGLAGPGPCYMLRAEGPLMETLFGAREDEGDRGSGA